MGSTYNTHVDIPTPTWRTLLTHRPLPPSHPEHAISDDDTDDEAYVHRHEAAAQEERARLAGFLRKKNSSGTPKKEPSSSSATPKRLRSSSKPLEAIFPGPLECWKLVEAAKSLQGGEHGDGRSIQLAELRRNLDKFSVPLESLSALESFIGEEREKLKRALAKRSYLNSDIGRSRGVPFPNGTFTNGSTAPDPKKRKTFGCPESSIEACLLRKALDALESTENCFRAASQSTYAAMESLLSQTKWALPSSKSFANLQKSFEQAQLAESKRHAPGASRISMSQLIKDQINSETYSVVADAFKLNPLYKLNGRESNLPSPRRLKRKCPSPESGLLGGKIHSHGFSLDLELLKSNEAGSGSSSDLESGAAPSLDLGTALRSENLRRRRTVNRRVFSDSENIGIVPQTPSSGMTTPSQPSTPSSLRRLNKDHSIHHGDMHLRTAVTTPNPHLSYTRLSNEEHKDATSGNPPIVASAAQNKQCDTPESPGGASHEPEGGRTGSGLKLLPTNVVEKIAGDNDGEKNVGESSAEAQPGSENEQERESRLRVEPDTEDMPGTSEKQRLGIQEPIVADEIPKPDKHDTSGLERGHLLSVEIQVRMQGTGHEPGANTGISKKADMKSLESSGGSQFPERQGEGFKVGRSDEGISGAMAGAVIPIVPIVIPDRDSDDSSRPEPDSGEQREAAEANEKTFKTEQNSSSPESAVPEGNANSQEIITIE